MAYSLFAAIDVGSNEVSLCIYEISKKDGIRRLEQVRTTLELGSQTYTHGKISHKMTEQLCDILKGYARKMKEYQVKNYRACATSALREADNRLLVLDKVRLGTGINVEIISNSQQRFLCFKALALFDKEFQNIIEKGTALADVGSGNIQISLFCRRALVVSQNMKLGSLRLRERLGELEKETGDYHHLMSEYIENEIDTFYRVFLNEQSQGGGSFAIENLMGVGDQLKELFFYFDDKKTGRDKMIPVTREEFERAYHIISNQSLEEQAILHGISKEQASLILPTFMIYHKLFQKTNADTLWISRNNLCDGIGADYAGKTEKLAFGHDFTEDILNCSRNIARRYQNNRSHSDYVEGIALKIFDSLTGTYGLTDRQRLILQIAVILHNCGEFINMNNVPEVSYMIISTTEIIGISHEERIMTANVVRGQGRELHISDIIEENLVQEDYFTVARLSAILQIADALDKSHCRKCRKINAHIKGGELCVEALSLEDMTLERAVFERKAEYFEEVFGVRPVLKLKKV